MKTLLLLLTAAAGLGGCAVYPGPAYEQPYYGSVGAPVYPAYPYAVEPPVYIQGGGVYRSYDAPRYYPAPVRIVPHRPPPPVVHAVPRPGWGHGDRDHDGIPNRFDRDRNNDGVPDRAQRNRSADRDGDGVPDVAERRRENIEVPNLMDRRISGPGRK